METNLEPLIFKKKVKIKASKDQEKQLELEKIDTCQPEGPFEC